MTKRRPAHASRSLRRGDYALVTKPERRLAVRLGLQWWFDCRLFRLVRVMEGSGRWRVRVCPLAAFGDRLRERAQGVWAGADNTLRIGALARLPLREDWHTLAAARRALGRCLALDHLALLGADG